MSALVQIQNVSKVYERGKQKVEVLHHVDLDIQPRDFVALMGPSGSGKTTLLNLIGGLDSPTDGSITVGGSASTGCRRARWRAGARRMSASCSSSTICCRCCRRGATSSCRCC